MAARGVLLPRSSRKLPEAEIPPHAREGNRRPAITHVAVMMAGDRRRLFGDDDGGLGD